jgi:hypothetical protein
MYRNNINFSLTFLGLFLIKMVFGAPGNSSLAKNQGELKIVHLKSIDFDLNFELFGKQLRGSQVTCLLIFCGTHCSHSELEWRF